MRSNQKIRYTAYQYFKDAYFDRFDGSNFPADIVCQQILDRTQFDSLRAFRTELKKHKRWEASASLRKRLSKIFTIWKNMNEINEPVRFTHNDKQYVIPTPFVLAKKRVAIKIEIGSFWMDMKDNEFSSSIRMVLTAPRMLAPASDIAVAVCAAVENFDALEGDNALAPFHEWFKAAGIPRRIACDTGFISYFCLKLRDRIKESFGAYLPLNMGHEPIWVSGGSSTISYLKSDQSSS